MAFVLLMVLTACGGLPTPYATLYGCKVDCWPRRTLTPVPRNDAVAIRQIIDAEGEPTGDQNSDRLRELWAADAFIADAETGRTWQGWTAILDRYNKIGWPSKARTIGHVNIRVAVRGETAVAISDSVLIPVTHNDNDRWTLEKRGGKWQITNYTFGLSR